MAPAHPEDLAARVVDSVRQVLGTGLVGVIAAEPDRTEVGQALDAAGLSWASELQARAAPIVVMTAEQAKGLEFDNVVVVEPARIADESPRGLRALFVALTRPTSRLTLVHAKPLPQLLELESTVPPPDAPDAPAALLAPTEPPAGVQPLSGFGTGSDDAGAATGAGSEGSRNADLRRDEPATPPPSGANRTGEVAGAGRTHTNGVRDEAESLAALDRAMARAIAGKLAETLARYVTPALVPLVLDEMREVLEREQPQRRS